MRLIAVGPILQLFIGLLLAAARTPSPKIEALQFDADDVKVLIAIDDIHQAAKDGGRLLAWSIFADFLNTIPSDRKPKEVLTEAVLSKLLDIALSAKEPDWTALDKRFSTAVTLDKIALLSCADLCQARELAHQKPGKHDQTARVFWRALKVRYLDAAKRLERN